MPVISVTGPRQSGKTTLVKMIFPDYLYLDLEIPEIRELAIKDPRSFLSGHDKGLIIDEIQYAPQLLSYIKSLTDETGKNGKFIITGSQNLLLLESIAQSLAGRVAIFNLLPFSIEELLTSGHFQDDYQDLLVKGFYPRLYAEGLSPDDLYPSYIQTYLERDVRRIINVKDLSKYQSFIKVAAGMIGHTINLTSMSNDLGIDQKTIKSWISVLEASFIVFLLPPYYRNFNKRIIKAPKLYFYDTGLACSILDIKDRRQLESYYNRGNLFESFILSEMFKSQFNSGVKPYFYFFRDNSGNEVDVLFEQGVTITGVEVKSSKTVHSDFFKGLNFWQKLTGTSRPGYLVYGGRLNQKVNQVQILGWEHVNDIFNADIDSAQS